MLYHAIKAANLTCYPFTRWRKGVNWSEARQVLRRPSTCHPGVHLVSNSWCGGRCQLWAEGALEEVDRLFVDYFKEWRTRV